MEKGVTPYVAALSGIAGIAWLSVAFLPILGLASAALLFLLPVLYAATRGGVAPGLIAALTGAAVYNFLLLPPRFTFRVHGLDNIISLCVLMIVALVTSRLATLLTAREAEAREQARMSEEGAQLSAILAGNPAENALDRGIAWLAERYGSLRLLPAGALPQDAAAFSSLDMSAAAWAIHNGDMTGHGTGVMPAADWSFLPLYPRNRRDGAVVALARPADGTTRGVVELDHLLQLGLRLGQCRDRDSLENERRQRALLEESERLRRTFLASLGHDFRTPLTIISGRLAMLASDDADVSDALVAAQRLDHMMTDLLGAARIESDALAPAMENVDPVDAMGAAIDGIVVPLGISITRDIAADLPFVRADPMLLHHILTNLIDNAVRHAVCHVAVSAHEARGTVLFSISDDGAGIAEGERTRISERFVRLEGGDRKRGSGLGLAIVKGFADAMGMTVTVDTAHSGGARFTLAMPQAMAAPS